MTLTLEKCGAEVAHHWHHLPILLPVTVIIDFLVAWVVVVPTASLLSNGAGCNITDCSDLKTSHSITFPNLPPSVSVWVVHLNAVNISIYFLVSTNGIKMLLVCHQ